MRHITITTRVTFTCISSSSFNSFSMDKQKRDEMIEASKKRQKLAQEKSASASGDSSSPQQGMTANAGMQLTGAPAGAPAGNLSNAPAPPAPNAAPNAVGIVGPEPNIFFKHDHFKQIVPMNTESIKALAAAMVDVKGKPMIDVGSKSKTMIMHDIVHFYGTGDIKTFDVANDTYEFADLKRQDFQQPAAPQS